MIVYVAMYRSNLSGWQPIMRAMTASTQRLCAFVSRDSAKKCIRNLKYRFPDGTDFRIAKLVELN